MDKADSNLYQATQADRQQAYVSVGKQRSNVLEGWSYYPGPLLWWHFF